MKAWIEIGAGLDWALGLASKASTIYRILALKNLISLNDTGVCYDTKIDDTDHDCSLIVKRSGNLDVDFPA